MVVAILTKRSSDNANLMYNLVKRQVKPDSYQIADKGKNRVDLAQGSIVSKSLDI